MSLLRGTSIVASLTLVSRILGFVRDLLTARVFGTGMQADAYIVAFRIPNLLRSLFAEGALSSAFVPTFVTELSKGKEEARQAAREVAGFLIAITILTSIIGIIFAVPIVRIFAPGFIAIPEKERLSILLTQIMMPYIIFVSIVALINGALNSVKNFGASAFAQVVMNLVLIVGAVLAALPESLSSGAVILAISVIVGGFIQVIVQFKALKKNELLVLPKLTFNTPVIRATVKLMLPAVLGAGIYQLSIFVTTCFASKVSEGAVSWLFYADRIVQLPVGVFSIALASVLLPTLSSSVTSGDEKAFNTNLHKSLVATTLVTVWMTLILFCFAEPLTRLLFERGKFSHFSTVQTALAVQIMAFSIWAVSCYSMVNRAFVANKDTVTPTIIGVCSLLTLTVFSLLLMGRFGHLGLCLASSIASLVTFAIGALLINKVASGFRWHSFVKTAFITWLIALLIWVAKYNFTLSNSPSALLLIAEMTFVSFLYFFLLWSVRIPEIHETFSLISRLLVDGREDKISRKKR